MRGLDPRIHHLAKKMDCRAWASEATSFFERLRPAMTLQGISVKNELL
jgi:hypothetical protein